MSITWIECRGRMPTHASGFARDRFHSVNERRIRMEMNFGHVRHIEEKVQLDKRSIDEEKEADEQITNVE